MDDLKRQRLILDNAGRDLVSLPYGVGDRVWAWATSDGALVAGAGVLLALGGGRFRFDARSDRATQAFTGLEGTEADLGALIGANLGWRMPVQPVQAS